MTSNFGTKPCFLSSLRINRRRRPTVASALDEYVENLALVIHGTPQIHPPSGDANHHLVEMPAIARSRAPAPQFARDEGTEFQYPAPYRFIGEVEPSLGQQFLDIAQAEMEAEVEPDSVADDFDRVPIASVRRGLSNGN